MARYPVLSIVTSTITVFESECTLTCHSTSTLDQLKHEVVEKEERIAELRHALTMLDRDHDALRADTDAKDETIALLQQQVQAQVSK